MRDWGLFSLRKRAVHISIQCKPGTRSMNAPRVCPICGMESIEPLALDPQLSLSFGGQRLAGSDLVAYRCDVGHLFIVLHRTERREGPLKVIRRAACSCNGAVSGVPRTRAVHVGATDRVSPHCTERKRTDCAAFSTRVVARLASDGASPRKQASSGGASSKTRRPVELDWRIPLSRAVRQSVCSQLTPSEAIPCCSGCYPLQADCSTCVRLLGSSPWLRHDFNRFHD